MEDKYEYVEEEWKPLSARRNPCKNIRYEEANKDNLLGIQKTTESSLGVGEIIHFLKSLGPQAPPNNHKVGSTKP